MYFFRHIEYFNFMTRKILVTSRATLDWVLDSESHIQSPSVKLPSWEIFRLELYLYCAECCLYAKSWSCWGFSKSAFEIYFILYFITRNFPYGKICIIVEPYWKKYVIYDCSDISDETNWVWRSQYIRKVHVPMDYNCLYIACQHELFSSVYLTDITSGFFLDK